MNNFRHPHPKPFGSRGADLPNPWMTEEELLTMRRQNSQFNPTMQNLPPSMHSPLLNQSNMLPTSNKNFMNQNSCKMPSSNFARSPNMDVFKSSYMNESNYSSRFVGNRFPNNSFPHMNVQHKMNEGAPFKDFTSSNVMSSQSNKNDGFSDNISKPLFANTRQPQERFSCMQNDQSQFHSKFDNSRIYQEKGYPFSSDKDFQSQNHTPINEHMSSPSNFNSFKPNFRAPSLFPAYTPKDIQEESNKSVQQSGYNSNFMGKSNSFCDKTVLPSTFVGKSDSFCEKAPVTTTTYSKTMESFPGKTDPFQERNVSERVVNDLFPQDNTFMYDKQPLKTMSTSQVSQNSFKTLDDPATLPSMKYSFPSENQQPCYQSPEAIPMQRPQNVQNYPNTSTYSTSTSSKDCLMQGTPFSSQSDVPQSAKETFSSFNFESNINTTDIADLLPGLDAFLKEHLDKPEEAAPKNDVNKSSGSNCAFSDDEWSKHSIPFIGDNQTVNESNILNSNKDTLYDDPEYMKQKCSDKLELKTEKANELQLPEANQPKISSSAGENLPKTITPEKEAPKIRSALEEAIDMLVNNDAIVGLDYITEYKKNIAQVGSIPFRCKLCNSAITRPSIIDHILGSKHRMRYLKTKDESKYEYIVSLKIEKSEKDAKIAEAAFELEKVYGRGCVTVNTVDYQKDSCADNSKEMEYGTEEPVFTLDKIPIGFEALSPQHEEMSTEFTLESNQDVSSVKKETSNILMSEEKKNVSCNVSSSNTAFTLPGLEGDSSFHDTKTDVKSMSPHLNLENEVPKISNVSKESETKVLLQLSDNGTSYPAKRASPFEESSPTKIQKIDSSDESKTCTGIDEKKPEVKSEDSLHEIKKFNLDIFEKLSQSTISSDEEASVVLRTINILMDLLLRYKLRHLSLEKVEKLMKSLQNKSSEAIEDLSTFLQDSKTVESKNVETTIPLVKDTTDNVQLKPDIALEDNSGRQVKSEPSGLAGSSNLATNELDLPVKTVSSNSSDPIVSTKVLPPVSDVVGNNANNSAPQHSGLVTTGSTTEISKNVSDTTCMSQTSKVPVSNSVGLKPPPFFGWPQTSEGVSNQVCYAAVQGSQSMIWTSPYQQTQAQYSQMPYYQPQNYGNTFSGSQAYQTQFPVLPQNSVPMEMAQPPLPPPPPPPPPAPSNPPLPPLPNSRLYPSSVNSHSVPMPNNPSACVSMYSNQPPLPPHLP